MIYGVFGPREKVKGEVYTDFEHVTRWLDTVDDLDTLVAGGAKGVETLAQRWAENQKVPFVLVKPIFVSGLNDGTLPVKIAFDNRNMEILNQVDAVLVFWDGRFKDMITIFMTAVSMGKRVVLFPM